MKHLFVDTNVLLDFIMRRAPFAVPAAELFQLAENRSIWLYCSSLSFSQAYYILRKVVGSVKAQEILLDIADIVTIIAVDSRNVNDALRSSFAISKMRCNILQHQLRQRPQCSHPNPLSKPS